MVNYFCAFRRFERFVFRGVPEHPEPIWERTINANVVDRHTGRSHITEQRNSHDTEENRLIATIVFRPDLKQIEVIREGQEPKEASRGSAAELRHRHRRE
jgi:hypothetical protein